MEMIKSPGTPAIKAARGGGAGGGAGAAARPTAAQRQRRFPDWGRSSKGRSCRTQTPEQSVVLVRLQLNVTPRWRREAGPARWTFQGSWFRGSGPSAVSSSDAGVNQARVHHLHLQSKAAG